jgi:hypothetical protein
MMQRWENNATDARRWMKDMEWEDLVDLLDGL